jgi:phage-related protein
MSGARRLVFEFLGVDRLSNTTREMAGHVEGLGGSIKKLAAAGTGLLAGVGLVDFFRDTATEARESAKVGALTTQVIKSTGDASKLTAEQVGDLATKISNLTGVDDEAVQGAENLLLTFTKVRNETGKNNDIFTQATKTVTDMSVALGEDMNAAAIQVGKALNDPIAGVTALRKVGVSFTDDQRKQIKTLVEHNKTLDAQKIILKELNTEFGGAAAAASTPAQKAAVAWGNLKEQIGGLLLPVIDRLATAMSTTLLPAVSSVVDKVGPALQGALSKLGPLFDKVFNARNASTFLSLLGKGFRDAEVVVKEVGPPLEKVAVSTVKLGEAFGRSLGPAIMPVVKDALPKLLTAVKDIVSVAGRFLGWLSGSSLGARELRGILIGMAVAMLAIKTVMLAAAVAAKIWAAAQFILNLVLDANPIGLLVIAIGALVGAFVVAWQHSERFRAVIEGVLGWIAGHWQLLISIILGPIGIIISLLVTYWSQIVNAIQTAVTTVINFVTSHWQLIISIILGPFGIIIALLVTYWDQISGAVRGGVNRVIGFVGGLAALPGRVAGWFADIYNRATGKLNDMVNFVSGMPGKIARAATGMWDGIWSAFKGTINTLIRGWNGLQFKIPSVDTHIPGVGKVGGFTLGVPDVPLLARGGSITRPGTVVVGDDGPELLNLPAGASVVPLRPGSAAAGGSLVVNITINAGLGTDPTEVAAELERVFLRFTRQTGRPLQFKTAG